MIQSKEKIPEMWKHCFQFSQQLYKKKEKTKDLRLDKKKKKKKEVRDSSINA